MIFRMKKTKKQAFITLFCQSHLNHENFNRFIHSVGMNNIKTKDLEKIVEHFGPDTRLHAHFHDIYKIVTSNETNKTMKKLTVIMLLLAFISTIIAVLLAILQFTSANL